MNAWTDELCPSCEGEQAFDMSDPGGPTIAKMESCEACAGSGAPCCEVPAATGPCGCSAIMRAVVLGTDNIEAKTLYLCDDCADQANLDGRLAQILTSAYGTSGQDTGDDGRVVRWFDLNIRGGHAHVVAKEGGVVGVQYDSISQVASRMLLNISPDMAIELGSRLIQAGQFAARKPGRA